MSKQTYRDPSHPWNQFKGMEEKFKKILTTMSNENLDAKLALLPQDVYPELVSHGWKRLKRPEKIRLCMKEWEHNYRVKFKQQMGFDLEDTKDPVKFKKHFKKFRRQTKRALFFGRIAVFFEGLFGKKQQPKIRITK